MIVHPAFYRVLMANLIRWLRWIVAPVGVASVWSFHGRTIHTLTSAHYAHHLSSDLNWISKQSKDFSVFHQVPVAHLLVPSVAWSSFLDLRFLFISIQLLFLRSRWSSLNFFFELLLSWSSWWIHPHRSPRRRLITISLESHPTGS